MLFFLDLCASVAPVPIRVLFIRNHGLLRMLFFLDPCRSITSMRIRVLFIKQPRIATDETDCHGCCSFIIRADPLHPCRSVVYSSLVGQSPPEGAAAAMHATAYNDIFFI